MPGRLKVKPPTVAPTITPIAAFLSTACSGPLSTLDTAGPAAGTIATLWWVMLAGSMAILALVLALLALAFTRKDKASPSQRAWIVGGGLVFPGVILAALLAYGLVVGEKLLPRQSPKVVQTAAEAERWRWTFTQQAPDGTQFVSVGTLHIPANRPVDVAITTRDVIHSFWVPRLAGKLDAIPGKTNILRIEASEPGVYEAQCAEYCGIGHSGHNFRVIAHDWGSRQ